NYVFKNNLPKNQTSFVKEYERLFMYFLFLKGAMIGLAGYHQVLSEDLVLKLIQSFTKALDSNADFRNLMENILDK
ncbi:MAG: hypothetical protein RR595_15735, partial [Lysinibacillus sp.]